MRVDVAHFVGVQARVGKRVYHGLGRAFTGRIRLGDVAAIPAHAKPDQLGIDSGASFPGAFEFLEDQDGPAFRDHEPIAFPVEGAAGRGRVVIPFGERLQ